MGTGLSKVIFLNNSQEHFIQHNISFLLLQERVERKVDESHFVTENRIQKLDEAILEERAKIADIEHVRLFTQQILQTSFEIITIGCMVYNSFMTSFILYIDLYHMIFSVTLVYTT